MDAEVISEAGLGVAFLVANPKAEGSFRKSSRILSPVLTKTFVVHEGLWTKVMNVEAVLNA